MFVICKGEAFGRLFCLLPCGMLSVAESRFCFWRDGESIGFFVREERGMVSWWLLTLGFCLCVHQRWGCMARVFLFFVAVEFLKEREQSSCRVFERKREEVMAKGAVHVCVSAS